jgi:hypothetical protein
MLKFLMQKRNVKVCIVFPTNEAVDSELAKAMLDNIAERLADFGKGLPIRYDRSAVTRFFVPGAKKVKKKKAPTEATTQQEVAAEALPVSAEGATETAQEGQGEKGNQEVPAPKKVKRKERAPKVEEKVAEKPKIVEEDKNDEEDDDDIIEIPRAEFFDDEEEDDRWARKKKLREEKDKKKKFKHVEEEKDQQTDDEDVDIDAMIASGSEQADTNSRKQGKYQKKLDRGKQVHESDVEHVSTFPLFKDKGKRKRNRKRKRQTTTKHDYRGINLFK